MNQSYPPQPSNGPRTSTLAVISLIAGLLGVVQILPLIGPIAAVITGHLAKKEIRQGAGLLTGNGLATTGLVLGYLMLVISVCLLCVAILAFAGMITLPFAFPTIRNTTY